MTDVVPYRLVPSDGIDVLDQTLLPHEERWLELTSLEALCEAIRSLRVRGAPFLGLMGAAGMALAASTIGAGEASLRVALATIAATRPTAVDLGQVAGQALEFALGLPESDRSDALWACAADLGRARLVEDRAMGEYGARELSFAATVLTHCNTGALATGGVGTALAVIRTAFEAGSLRHSYATETRPLLQGARLTMWELGRLDIPATLLPDTAVASLLASGAVDAVITGADRIARNGDAANKIGTQGIALIARACGVPFYIAAPRSTFDPACANGAGIPIEFRDANEVGAFGSVRTAPAGIAAYNPAFDVTPAGLITAIITESGVLRPPYDASVAAYLG